MTSENNNNNKQLKQALARRAHRMSPQSDEWQHNVLREMQRRHKARRLRLAWMAGTLAAAAAVAVIVIVMNSASVSHPLPVAAQPDKWAPPAQPPVVCNMAEPPAPVTLPAAVPTAPQQPEPALLSDEVFAGITVPDIEDTVGELLACRRQIIVAMPSGDVITEFEPLKYE